jgi:threonine dehydrogenase-like Zn-dependent dehydrogenase
MTMRASRPVVCGRDGGVATGGTRTHPEEPRRHEGSRLPRHRRHTRRRRTGPDDRGADRRRHPGDAPSQALRWAVESLAKAGTLAIVGVYPPTVETFPIGQAMNKNITIQMGNCNHRRYVPHLVDLVASGTVDPVGVLTQIDTLSSGIEAYEAFDRREPGWLKVELEPAAA